MSVNTAVHQPAATAEPASRAPLAVVEEARWKRRYLLSSFRDRRSLGEIGGLGAYLAQVGWSLWWALRRSPAGR